MKLDLSTSNDLVFRGFGNYETIPVKPKWIDLGIPDDAANLSSVFPSRRTDDYFIQATPPQQ